MTADYIERGEVFERLYKAWGNEVDASYCNVMMDVVNSVPSVPVVPWKRLEEYARGKRCNFASDFVLEAKQAYEEESSGGGSTP